MEEVVKLKRKILMEEVVKFLKECGAYFLATVDGDQPRVRPFGTANIFDRRNTRPRRPPRTEGRHARTLPRAQVDVLPRRRQHRNALLQGCDRYVLQLHCGSAYREVLTGSSAV